MINLCLILSSIHENDIISLAYFEKKKQNVDFSGNGAKFGRALWTSANHNTGIYITRPLWNKIKDCSNVIVFFVAVLIVHLVCFNRNFVHMMIIIGTGHFKNLANHA